MQIAIRKIEKNILQVNCQNKEGKNVSGAQILPEIQSRMVENCDIQADMQEEMISFAKAGKVLTRQVICTLEEKEVFRYTFTGKAPVIVTEKTIDGERSFVKNVETVKVADAYEGKISFSLEREEAIYGLGQQENGYFNYRNVKEYLYQNNMKIPMPVLLSSKGYALLFDVSCMFTYEEKDSVMTLTFDAVEGITYYVISGENFDALIHGIRSLTGKAMMLPKWAFGYVQSKERYKSQEEILATVEAFNKRKIPLSCIVLDWMSWDEGKWGNKMFDKSRFPDAKAMVDKLHKDKVSFMISIWPNMNKGTDNNEEMAKAGKLLCNNSTYDAFDEKARELYFKQCEKELFAAGTDAWWCDSTEPFTPDWNGAEKRPDEVRYQMAKETTNKYLDARYSNIYALEHAKGIYDNQRAVSTEKRVLNLTRSGSLGSQRYGTVLWSGDIAATWEVLKHQIAEGLSICMSGIPYWTMDAGAFFTGTLECWRRFTNQPEAEGPHPWFWHGLFEKGVEDLGYREFYVRCLQLAAYLPMMRSHGTDTPREPWNFGEEGSIFYETIVKYIRKRYEMMPYSYSLAWKVYKEDYTLMRSLMFDFSEDPNVKDLWSEFMYGSAYLICPVTRPMEYGPESTPLNSDYMVNIYLPKGAAWYKEDSGVMYQGGQEIQVEARVETMPVFIRAGSIIPTSKNTSGECDEVHIYSSADGNFKLYLDNGMDYSFLQGEYSILSFDWNDQVKTLIISVDEEDYKLPEKLKFILHTHREVWEKEISIDKKKKSVKF